MMIAKIDNQTTKYAKAGALILVGWFTCSWWYGTLHLTQSDAKLHVVETVDVPKIKALAGCQSVALAQAKDQAASPIIQDPSQIQNCPPLSSIKNLGKK